VNGDQADNDAAASGAVYVYTRTGTTWAQQAYVKASNTGAADEFGTALALAGDLLAVGAQNEDCSSTGVNGSQGNNLASNSGAAYVFRRSGSTWTQEAYVKASNTEPSDAFGGNLAIAGEILVVGARNEDSSATGVGGNQGSNGASNSGAVYVLRHDGTRWSQSAYVKGANTGASDLFGISVAVSRDALAVGGTGEASNASGIGGDGSNNLAPNSGAAYVFH
jgi:trimeric autotransporter adhesin